MDYIKQYKSFINSHYLNGAIRITVGILLPSILLSLFNNLPAGVSLSIGAMCVGNTDNPGPIHHRRNGMIACILIIFLVTLLIGLASPSHVWTGSLVLVFCFVFAFISVYGARAASIGVNALLVMVLNIDRQHTAFESLITATYVLAGGVWYTILSLLLYSFRPYRLVQQAIGDCIQALAGYLRIKAAFYARETDYDEDYRRLLESQVEVHAKQDLVRELLFKSRNIVQESTHVGRVLMMIFLDIIDLFERIMTSQQDYRRLHHFFDETELMQDCRRLILDLASELDEIGIAIMSGKPSVEDSGLPGHIRAVREQLELYRGSHRNPENAEAIASLNEILDSIEDLSLRLHTLHRYTTYDRKLSRNIKAEVDVEEFVAHTEVDRKLLLENLNFKSDAFRHAVRMSIATLAGYILASYLPEFLPKARGLGHGYWILLTIIVIMKPVYSLTRQRNYQRLIGTLGGGLIGFLLLFFVRDPRVLFVLMILFMIMTYVFIRTDYLVAVIMMTPYVLLLFHLLYPTDFRSILADRVIDTAIGSVIAGLASWVIIPTWEHERITDLMTAALEANIAYLKDVAGAFLGKPATVHQYKLSRKNAFVALANLSDALQRMLSEPRRKQKSMAEMHQFVVSNHMLTSHIATLAYYTETHAARFADAAYQPVVDDIVCRLEQTVDVLADRTVAEPKRPARADLLVLNERAKTVKGVKPIIDQFNFILKVTTDIAKVSQPLALTYRRPFANA